MRMESTQQTGAQQQGAGVQVEVVCLCDCLFVCAMYRCYFDTVVVLYYTMMCMYSMILVLLSVSIVVVFRGMCISNDHC